MSITPESLDVRDMVEDFDVYEPTTSERVSQTVVRALADSKGVDPTELDERLYDVVDPDALDALFDTTGGAGAGQVSFSMADRCIVVDQASRVHVLDSEEPEAVEDPAALDPTTLGDAESCENLVF